MRPIPIATHDGLLRTTLLKVLAQSFYLKNLPPSSSAFWPQRVQAHHGVRGYFQLIKKETKIFILFIFIQTSSFAILKVAYVYVIKYL
jgi:hypothetical protein